MSLASSVAGQRLQRSQQRYQAAPAQTPMPPLHHYPPANFKVATSAMPSDNFISKVVDQCGTAVVKILTEQTRDETSGGDLEDLLESLFGGGEVFIGGDGVIFGGEETRKKKKRVTRGQGSGFFIDSTTVVTNAHVVKGTSSLKILLTTGEQLVGTVRGLDSVLDVAVVAVSVPAGMRIPALVLNDGSKLKVGQWAISMGNPLGLNNSVSLGIVSSLRPNVEASVDWQSHDYLQTDAAINTGNSGGPLLNERGEVIGIVTAKAGGLNTEGLGFAIPIGRVLPVLHALLAGRPIPHPMLGIQLTEAHTQAAALIREEYDCPPDNVTPGALVIGVLP